MRVYQSPRGVRSLFAFINLILRHFQAHRAGPDPSRAHRRDKNSSVKYREGELHSRLRGRSLKKKKTYRTTLPICWTKTRQARNDGVPEQVVSRLCRSFLIAPAETRDKHYTVCVLALLQRGGKLSLKTSLQKTMMNARSLFAAFPS